MKNNKKNIIELIKTKLHNNNADAILIGISNEHLYEYVDDKDNYIVDITGFTGDTGYVLIKNKKNYLIVDGRFITQAKKEVDKKQFEIVIIDSEFSLSDFLVDAMNANETLLIDSKKISAKKAIMYENILAEKNVKIKFKNDILNSIFKYKITNKETNENKLFILPKVSGVEETKIKLKKINNEIKKQNIDNYVYLTSNIEEIGFLTNLRLEPKTKTDTKVLFDSFLILNENEIFLFIKDYISKEILKVLGSNRIKVLSYESFYKILNSLNIRQLKKLSVDEKRILNILKESNILLSETINNYFILSSVMNNAYIINSPIEKLKSIRTKKEIRALKMCNIIDSALITKAIYKIKKLDYKKNKITEYDIKNIVDLERTKNEKFLCNSFDTIVAYKENSAICHYVPKKQNAKIIKNNSILLIDSGGHYVIGTTDLTRTISLYDKKIPKKLKWHYTLVLKSLINVYTQKLKKGTKANYIDILGRKILYNENLDFLHGLGHGIGYISNVHEGPNNFSKFDTENNTLEIGEVSSVEPGLYFENQYGIRLENDVYVDNDKNNYLKFTNLTYCPFDISLIDVKILNDDEKKIINAYHKTCYNVLKKYMNKKELQWLKISTNKI